MDNLKQSWNAFSKEVAKQYLDTFGHPSTTSRQLLFERLKAMKKKPLRVIDFGCGNGQLCQYFLENGLQMEYVGLDFSTALLDVAREKLQSYPQVDFIEADINEPSEIRGPFDVAIYSHVFELLSSPEQSLHYARRLAGTVMIRFYEPPEFEFNTVELREMDLGAEPVAYIRRKMSQDYYRMILAKEGCQRVDVYKDSGSKDQIHVLSFHP